MPDLQVGARVKLKDGVMFGPIMELTVDRVFKNGKAEASSDDRKTRVKVFHSDFVIKPLSPACWCRTCETAYGDAMDAYDKDWWMHAGPFHGMTLCPDCGNKRCPRANYHDRTCTGSNAPGQEGSAYV